MVTLMVTVMGSVMVTIILWLAAILLAVLAMVVTLPLRLEVDLRKDAEWRVAAAIRPFGRLGPRLAFARKQPSQPTTKARRRRPFPTARNARAVAAALPGLLTDILACIRIARLTVDARFGLGDPAATGHVFGMVTPVIYGTSAARGIEVHVEPVFDRTILTGAARLVICVIPITLIAPVLRFGWRVLGPAR